MRQNREGSIDFLKVLATCVIIMHHFQQVTNSFFEGQLNFYFGKFYWGYMVELFFIISGYFTYKYVGSATEDSFFSFFWKKYKRFLPLLPLAGAVCTLSGYYFAHKGGTAFAYGLWECLAGMFGFGRWFSEVVVINNPVWYISVLLLCYAVFYSVDFVAKRLGVKPNSAYLLVIVMGVLMYHVCSNYNDFNMPLFSMSIGRGLICFFLGLLLRDILEKHRIHEKRSCVLLCAAYVIGFIVIYVQRNGFVSNNLYYLLSFTVFPSVVIVFKSKLMQKLCAGKVFAVLGNISYHAFMWHSLVLEIIFKIYQVLGISVNRLPIMYMSVVVTFLVGSLSYWITKVVSCHYRAKKTAGTVNGV